MHRIFKAGGREGGGPVYIDRMKKALGRPPLTSKIFGGKMILAEMNEEDRRRTEAFSKKQGMPFKDVRIMKENEIDEFVQDIKEKINL